MSGNYFSVPPAATRSAPPQGGGLGDGPGAGTGWLSASSTNFFARIQKPASKPNLSPPSTQSDDFIGPHLNSRSAPVLNVSQVVKPPVVARPVPQGKISFDKDDGAVIHPSLTDSKMTVQAKTTDAWVSALASRGLGLGKIYFEVRVLSLPDTSSIRIGMAVKDKFSDSTPIGGQPGAACVDLRASKAFADTRQMDYKMTVEAGNAIGLLLDLDKRQFEVTVNGSLIGQSKIPLPQGILYPAVSLGPGSSVTANFGTAPFESSPFLPFVAMEISPHLQ